MSDVSALRVARFRAKQKRAGRVPVTLYLDRELVKMLDELSRPKTRGEVVEQALGRLHAEAGAQEDIGAKNYAI